MRRSRKIRGGDSTISVSTDAVSKLAADANQLAEDLGKLVPAEPAVQSDLSATPSVPAVVQSNVQPGDQPSNDAAVQSPNPVVDQNAVVPTAVVQNDAAAAVQSPNPVVDQNAVVPTAVVQNDAAAAVQSPNPVVDPTAVVPTAVVQNDAAAGTPNVPGSAAQPNNAGSDQPSNAATSEPDSLLTPGSMIHYGRGLTIPYGYISRILENMISNPTKYNKQNKPISDLQALLTQIQSAKTEMDVTHILTKNGFQAPVGKGVSKQYFPMLGGTKKRKRTKMTNRRKTRKMKKTRKMRKMRKMRKTMKI